VGIGVGVGVGAGDGVGDGVGVGVCDGLGVGLAAGESAVVGTGPAPPDPGRIATRDRATTRTAANAMKDGAAALRVIDRVTFRVVMH
jgi:hypothetical protein